MSLRHRKGAALLVLCFLFLLLVVRVLQPLGHPSSASNRYLVNSTHPNSSSHPVTAALGRNETSVGQFGESMAVRRAYLRKRCEELGLRDRVTSFWRRASNKIKGRTYYCSTKNCPIIASEDKGALLCFIQKVASTSLKQYWLQMEGKGLVESNSTAFHSQANDILLRVSPMFYPQKKLATFKKVIFVRHPFSRLVSAFMDKGNQPRAAVPYFYDKYWDRVMKERRGEGNVTSASRPTFSEFVDVVISSGAVDADEHWAPYWSRCEPCLFDYDFIGKLETALRDFEVLEGFLKTSSIPAKIWQNKNPNGSLTMKQVKTYYSQLSPQQLIKLYKKYYWDFLLFGYSLKDVFRS